jgi:hypothetical protein
MKKRKRIIKKKRGRGLDPPLGGILWEALEPPGG